jgi:TRAP-type C4-dicarboxylate transport system permease small subunit
MKFIEIAFTKAARSMNYIAAVGLFIVMVAVILNILLRVLFNSPVMGTYEIVQYGVLLAVSLALADNELMDGNVMVSYFLEKMKPKAANLCMIAMNLISIICCGFVTYNQTKMIATKYANQAATSILQLPHWIIVLILTLGFLILTLPLILKLIRLVAQHKTLPDYRPSLDEGLHEE